ncbi:MAG: DUF1801 domain-containing protein [Anaerolineales bacterium]|nr:DUF1801 domain-containing protein [Anaerolineales bacterium]
MSPAKVTKKSSAGLSREEIAAMKETLKERKMAANKEEMEKAVFAAFAKMNDAERSMAKKIHEIVKATAPALTPKTWYGMPAYANADGKVVCFFQAGSKFGSRYCTFGLTDSANLDDGNMWAAGFALVKMTDAEEKRIAALVKKAAS